MLGTLTTSMNRRLAHAAVAPRIEDLYSPAGARFYEETVGGDRSEIREFLALARPVSGRILDLAAGGGRITLPLLALGKRVTALDLSPAMLELLRDRAPDDAAVELVCADMRAFALDARFDLIVLAATSLTLLDGPGRRQLFDAVAAHLAPGGRFAVSVAGPDALRELRRTIDREVMATRGDRVVHYLSSQEAVAGGAERIVNFVSLEDDAEVVFTTRVHVLDSAGVADELVAAGFSPPTTMPIRVAGATPGAHLVILETTWPR